MEKLPNDIRKKLRRYVSHLESRIKFEKDSLKMIRPAGGIKTFEHADVYRAMTEPIARTITAYERAVSELYETFPELRKRK